MSRGRIGWFGLVLAIFSPVCKSISCCSRRRGKHHQRWTIQTCLLIPCSRFPVCCSFPNALVVVNRCPRPRRHCRKWRSLSFHTRRPCHSTQPPSSPSVLHPSTCSLVGMSQQSTPANVLQASMMQLNPQAALPPPNSYYPDPPNDLTGGLPINLDSLRDGPPGSKPFYPYSTLIRFVLFREAFSVFDPSQATVWNCFSRYAIKGSPNQKLLLEDIYYAIESRVSLGGFSSFIMTYNYQPVPLFPQCSGWLEGEYQMTLIVCLQVDNNSECPLELRSPQLIIESMLRKSTTTLDWSWKGLLLDCQRQRRPTNWRTPYSKEA